MTVDVNNLPTVNLSASPATITEGESATLSWTSTNADTLTLDPGGVDVTGIPSYNVSPVVTTAYTITATNDYGTDTDSVTITVNNLPIVSLDVDPSEIIIGETSSLSWSSSDAQSVYLNQGLGSQLVNVTNSTGVSLTVDTTYVIIATNAYGSRSASAAITVAEEPLPTVSISASPNPITSGESSTLNWTSTDAETVEIDQGIGTVASSGTHEVTLTESTTYTITATNEYGSAIDTVTVVVNQPPVVSITASCTTITEGETTTLIWDSSGADSCTIDQGVDTGGAVSGTADVTPTITTTYTVTAENDYGSTTDSITIAVNPLSTIDTFTASADSINNGGTTTLSWTTTNADSASIDHGVGVVEVSGTTDVSPVMTTTYTLTALNDYGTRASSMTITVTQLPIVGISASPGVITAGDSSTLSWTASNADYVSIDQGIGAVTLSGTTSVSLAVTTTYTITTTNTYGDTTDSVTITVGDPPVIDFTADSTAITQGDSATLTWSVTDADTVSIDQGIGSVQLSDSLSVTPAATTTYTLTASNAYGSVTDSVTITVGQLPSVDISASPETITEGGIATLTWTSVNAQSCSIDQGIEAVTLSGSIAVSPSMTTTYTITATNTSGTATDSVTVTVNSLPTVSLSADPETIIKGESATLTWTSTGADTISLSHGIGSVALNGSTSISPSFTTTYTITATNAYGSVADTVTVTVYDVPGVSLDAEPANIITGGLTTLTWTSTDATSASMDQGIGSVDLSSSVSVSPTVTTTYTITADGPGGTATDSVTVTISDVVSVSITASASPISLSESTMLTWTSANADSASIDQGIGAVEVDGSVIVTPASTRTYTITVEGQAGTATASVEVVVYQPPEVTITAEPDRIISGDSSTLTWTSTNATSVSIDQEIGAVAVSGTMDVYPVLNTIYTITASGDWALDVATDSVTVGVAPREAAFIPTYSVVPGGYSYGITVVDLEAQTVAYTLDDVGNKPVGIVPDSSLDYIYVSCLADQTVEKIDVFTGEKLATIDVTDLPRDIAMTPEGSTVYVSLHNNEYNGGANIPVIDTATDTLVDTASTPNDAKAIDMSPDGAWLYASSVWGHSSEDQTFYVSVFDTTTNNDEVVINVDPYHPFDLVASPDGSRVYIANLEEGLSYIDTGDYSYHGPVITEADKQYIRLEVSPDGAYIYAVTQNVRLWDNYKPGISVIDASDFSLVATLDIAQSYLSFSGIDIHPTRDELYVVYSDTALLPDFYVIDISDPAAPTISTSLSIGDHDDLYGEFLIIRP